MRQRAVIVRYDLAVGVKKPDQAEVEATSELNALLSDGWQVVSLSPLSGYGGSFLAVGVAILQR